MTILAKTTIAKQPRTSESQLIAYLYAIILVIFAVAQLFTFDKFLILIEVFSLPGGITTAYLLATTIVISEVLALPFLLRLELSPLMRYLSMIQAWLVPSLWLFISIWISINNTGVTNLGLLGAVFNVMPGWRAVFIGIALVSLSAWSTWGLWPGKRT